MKLKKFFVVNVNKYVPFKNFKVYRPASLDYPKDEAVMFIIKEFMEYIDAFLKCENCLVFGQKKLRSLKK